MAWFKKPKAEFWQAVVPALLVGAAGGVLAAIATWSSLLEYRTSLLIGGPVGTVSDRRRPITAETEWLNKIQEETALSLVDFFTAKPGADAVYRPDEALGHGAVLTTDGWVLTHRSVVDPRRKSALRVGIGASLFSPETVVEDVETGIVFVKVDAQNLRAAVFGTSAELRASEVVALAASNHRVLVRRVDEPLGRGSPFAASDVLEARVRLADGVPSEFAGSLVINNEGAVVAMAVQDTDGTVRSAVPSDHFTPLFADLLARGALIRPTLGLRGVHLSGARTASGGRLRGFLITTDERTGARAVIAGSPADAAGLRVGDLITKINDQLLNGGTDLATILLARKPGDEVDLTVVRDGVEQVIAVLLGERDSGRSY